jgi:hypothetical protein
MPKRRTDYDDDLLARRMSAKPRWVKPRKQRKTPGRPCTLPWTRKRKDTPVSCLRDEQTLPALPHPQLVFERERPECVWIVPSVEVPLYYFDDTMLRKKLVIFHPPDTFTITGSDRVFKLVARQQVHRTFWNRYLVFEVRADMPHRGAP